MEKTKSKAPSNPDMKMIGKILTMMKNSTYHLQMTMTGMTGMKKKNTLSPLNFQGKKRKYLPNKKKKKQQKRKLLKKN